jgi:hypothetical protein
MAMAVKQIMKVVKKLAMMTQEILKVSKTGMKTATKLMMKLMRKIMMIQTMTVM